MIEQPNRRKIWTVVVAAGSGSRFGAPKQFVDLCGEPVVNRSVRVASTQSQGVVVVLPADSIDSAQSVGLLSDMDAIVKLVAGAESRSGSVRNGLAAVPDDADVILIHDGARPLASVGVYQRVISAVADGADAVVPVVPVTDTIRDLRAGVVDRSRLVAVQTPQGFPSGSIRLAHSGGGDATDDATLVEANGGRVVYVEGDPDNIKITDPSDLEIARLLLQRREENP